MIKTYLSYGLAALALIALTTLIALHDVPTNIINALIGLMVGSTGTHLAHTFFGTGTQVSVHLPANTSTTASSPTSGSIK